MPSRCIVAACSKSTKDGVSLHSHKIQNTDEFGTAAVKHTSAKWSGPTEHSTVCSAHFEPTCFDRGHYHQFDLTIKQMLLPDAVPIIFPLSKKAKVWKAGENQGKFESYRLNLKLKVVMAGTTP